MLAVIELFHLRPVRAKGDYVVHPVTDSIYSALVVELL